MKVRELMSGGVIYVAPEDTAATAARLIQRHNVGSLPVCGQDGRISGIVTDRDIVTRCIAAGSAPSAQRVGGIMSRDVISVSPEDEVGDAARLMADGRVRRVPVLSGGKLVGMLSLGDIARSRDFGMEAAMALSEISVNVRKGSGRA